MEVIVSNRRGTLRLAMVGQVDDAAPAIVEAALAVARSDGMRLLVDARQARPRGSPILEQVHQLLGAPRAHGVAWVV